MFDSPVTVKIGKYRLVEKDTRDDCICFIYYGRTRIGTYCSIRDALYHKGEWMEEPTASLLPEREYL